MESIGYHEVPRHCRNYRHSPIPYLLGFLVIRVRAAGVDTVTKRNAALVGTKDTALFRRKDKDPEARKELEARGLLPTQEQVAISKALMARAARKARFLREG